MPISISTNVVALSVQRRLSETSSALGQNFLRLASGLRVNSAKDDAGGLAVATRMTAQIRGLAVASQNANVGISVAQVADSATTETVNALQKIRDLAVSAYSATASTDDREALQADVDGMVAEITRVATGIKYNGLRLLAGSFQNMNFAIGANPGEFLAVSFGGVSTVKIGLGVAGSRVQISSRIRASTAIKAIDSALDSISTIRASIGSFQSRFESITSQIQSLSDAYESSRSRIMDTDVAMETAALTRNTIIQQAGISVLAQANLQPQILLQLLKQG